MKDEVTIRAMVEGDLGRYVPLRMEALRDYPHAFGSSYEEQVGDSTEAWREKVKRYNEGRDARLFVAEAGGELVGLTGVFRPPGVKVRHSATIVSVYVRPAFRGKGVSDRLMAAAIGWCRENGIRIVLLAASTSNAPAIRCYKRLGFKEYGVQPEVIRTADGVYHDEVLMWQRI